ncbi:Polyphenol oxidase [Hibiscus syriacus]|uniref:Polyphenol oxidase n=1 Tax=Hibiscus syriacus TaxID=106335 RepID=A0A6A3C8W3_HIBSY|nr:polyphenol oxidase, chloroplastic-like [Hibiscus syriacus]KAE8724241.1 Polyphenol oxidase [Hibiscus syriacus]
MASLFQSSPPATSTTIPTSIASSFFPKTSQLSTIRNPKHGVSCKAVNGDKFDRRDVLIGLGGLYYGATTLGDAMAAPVSAPEFEKCGRADVPEGVGMTDCCPPVSRKIVDFKLPSSNSRSRVRPAAHLVDEEYVRKYSKAIELMKALPDDDPRNFMQQANVHCAYCEGAYDQVGFPDLELQVHNSWLFFPFHRYYLYFFERILGHLIDDPTFGLPFWNWDSPAGMQMPRMYSDPNSSLYNELRNSRHYPPTMVDLDFNGDDVTTTNKAQIQSNLRIMYRQMVSNGKTPSLFLGGPFRAGDEPYGGSGSVENVPHGPVHIWCGDDKQPNGEDMGTFYSAARDPIFYAHHSNVDRTWSIWKTIGNRNRKDFNDQDWLNSSFLFYDENADLIRVKVRDCLDHRRLGYVYQDVEIPWLKAKPTPSGKRPSKGGSGIALAAEINEQKLVSGTESFPVVLDKIVRVNVERPKKSRSKKEKEEEEEILVIDVELKGDSFEKFDVYVNVEDEVNTGPDNTEFAGSFVNVPHKHTHGKKLKTCLRLGLSDLLEDLGAEDDDSVMVILVPKSINGNVKIDGIKIEFDN